MVDVGIQVPVETCRAENILPGKGQHVHAVQPGPGVLQPDGLRHHHGDTMPPGGKIPAEASRGKPEAAGKSEAKKFTADQTDMHLRSRVSLRCLKTIAHGFFHDGQQHLGMTTGYDGPVE